MTLRNKALSGLLATAAVLAGSLTIAAPASAATLTEITNFGANPDHVAPRPAVPLAAHFCTGSGPVFYSGTEFASLADQHGFIVIHPSATRSGSSSPACPRAR